MNWLSDHQNQIGALVVVGVLLGVGRTPLIAKVRQHRWLMWLAFAVTALCGLILGFALRDLVSWLVGRTSIAGFSIVGVVAVWCGWHAVAMGVDLVRDLADRVPDEDARKAALWIPTLLPAGGTAVLDIVRHPRGLGSGLTAAIIAGLTIVYAGHITRKALAGKTAGKAWKWFATAICLLAGLVAAPLVLFADGMVAQYAPQMVLWWRLIGGVLGLSLGVAAAVDIADKQPDKYVRAFLRFGLPLVIAFGALAAGWMITGATNGAQLLTGGTA